MLEVSELIYETCKTYLITQGKFILLLELFIGVIMIFYFGVLRDFAAIKVTVILIFSLIGIAGSYGVAWFGIRVNTFANSRAAFASLRGKPFPLYAIPLKAGMSIGMLLISVELFLMLCILLFIPARLRRLLFHRVRHRRIARRLGAADRRRHLHEDCRYRLRPDEDRLQHQGRRRPEPGRDCRLRRRQRRRLGGAERRRLRDLRRDRRRAHLVHPAGGSRAQVQVQLLVWIFVMRITMIVASGLSYFMNEAVATARYANVDKMNFEAPLTSLVWLTSIVSVVITYIVSWLLVPGLGDGTLWWKLSTVITCGTLAGAIIPELVKVFTSTESRHVREVVASSREGGASLNILSGFVAGNFSAYWLGLSIVTLMSIAYYVSLYGLESIMLAPAVFAFGLVAFGFLGMGPVTIAVDSYGPVTDNAQSVFELSVIESIPGIKEQLKRDYGFDAKFEHAKDLLEENDGAGNTFKATAKPVLIGTAVVGATTMIFSIIVLLTRG